MSDIENLRARIASLETSNRETLAIIDTKNRANSELLKELQDMQQKNTDLKKQVTELQQSVQAERAAATGAKWREQNLQQELNLTRQNNEWFEKEIQTKRDEAMKFRKEKGARISELERLNDDQRSTIDSLTRGEQQLRSRLKEAQDKVETSLTKIQQLQEAAAREEERHLQERTSAERLAHLQTEAIKASKQRLREVEHRLENVQDDFGNQKSRIEKQLEEEKTQHQKTFERVQELEQENSRLQATAPVQPAFGSRPQTPTANGSHLRAGSPFGTPGSLRSKSMTATQALDELWKTKTELINVKKRNQQLVQELDETMTILEAKAPEFNGLEAEIERLRAENIQMTQLADESYQERDIAKKAARRAESALSTAQSEVNILRAQLRDLGIQIQLLVFNMQAQEQGWEQLSEEEARRFDQLQRGEIAEGSLDDMSDTHRFITQKFVAFKDIHELQSKNQELLRITRELAEKMESEEALSAKQQAVDNERELLSLRETCARLHDEIKSITMRMASHIKERDMFRRMAESHNSGPGEVESPAGSQREVLASIEQNTTEEPEVTTMLRELQANFDDYRQQTSVDMKATREQADRLSSEKNSLQAEVARVRSQYDLAQERLSMLQSNYEALQNEKAELQRRSQGFSEAAAKQDLRSQQLAADLIENKALLDSLQSKNANLSAEKELSTSIRDRLTQDNESLTQEKARLSNALSQQQSLMNEREISESETRRGLQEQIESLKTELNTTKRKLSDEIDESRKLQQRKEYETQQHQQRVDELMASLNTVKEELVAAKTSKDHLQARVDELTIELRNAQEKAERLQPRPTPRPGTAADARGVDAETEAQIEELINENSDLKRDLDLANSHLASAQAQVQQYKDIAESVEEAQNELVATQEQYREQMDSELAAKEAQIKELQQRIEDVSTELSSSNSELNTLRDSQAEITRKFEDEKHILEEEISRIKDDAERLQERAKYHQQDLRAQADIAKKAQQDYESELVKHADAAKALQALRTQYHQLKNDSGTWKAEAESAKHTLDDNKRSFAEREQQLRQEVLELKERRREVDQQNKLLQEQLDSFASQLNSVKENRTAFLEAEDDSTMTVPGSDTERLTELNKYLHREKEILEVQLSLKTREAERLQQQLESKQSQLEEAQLKLEQERVARTDSSLATTQHELMAKLNELNVIRESNTIQRSENDRLQRQLGEKANKIQQLEAKIDPLKGEVGELESRREFLEQELAHMTEDRNRWQKRVETIVNQQGRFDPHEVEKMRETLVTLEAERDGLQQSQESLNAKITELETTRETEKSTWSAQRARIIEQAKSRDKDKSTKITELTTARDQLQTQLDEANERLVSLRSELDSASQEKSALEQRVAELQQQIDSADNTMQDAPAVDAPTASADQLAELQQQLESVRQELTAANEAKTAADEAVASLRSQLDVAIQERDAARAQTKTQPIAEPIPQVEAETTSQVQPEPTQNGEAAESQPAAATLSDTERAELEQKLTQAGARVAELEAEVADLQTKVSSSETFVKETLEKRSQKMKETLNKKLGEDKAKNKAELEQEKTKLQGEYDLKLQQERAIWEAENKATGAPAATTAAVASTPTKPDPQQPPQTPGGTLSTMLVADFAKLNDADTRQLLSSNGTLKQVVGNNIKSRVVLETQKIKEETEVSLKSEYESKIASAREQATLMESKKSALKINMTENKFRMATAKLNVVETVAKDTPERPVGEVWEEAKKAKPAPAVAPPQPAALSTPQKAGPGTPTGKLQLCIVYTRGFGTCSTDNFEATSAPSANGGTTLPPRPARPAGATPTTEKPAANPFVTNSQPSAPAAAPSNPFASSHPAAQPALPVAQPQAQQNQQQRTGIPVPSTGIPVATRGGAPGGRGRGGSNRGGRAGHQNQNRQASGAGLNPSAANFQAGNKRPNESDAGGNNPKRPRGGGGNPNRGGA